MILFNQDFSRNIPALNELYKDRFSQVYYLAPDHNSRLHNAYVSLARRQSGVWAADRLCSKFRRLLGKRNLGEIALKDEEAIRGQLLRVVGHQFFFYHFILQAAPALLASRSNWFWICGDDAILNPAIDENSIWEMVDSISHLEAVICRPVIASDHWLNKVGGSIESLERRLEKSLGTSAPWRGRYELSLDEGVERNRNVAVGCADFFGISRQALIKLLPYLQACFMSKVYVEVALPNAIMCAVSQVKFISNFNWQRVTNSYERHSLIKGFLSDQKSIFTHPIKLAQCSDAELNEICSRNSR